MINTILFNVDGTIIDSEFAILNSLQQTLVNEKRLLLPFESLEFVLGLPKKKAIRRLAFSEEEETILVSKWTEKMKAYSRRTDLFPGIENVLVELNRKNINLAIVTSKTREEMVSDFNYFDLNKYFKIIITASDTFRYMLSSDPILNALEILQSYPDETLYIGDSIYNMLESKTAGTKFGLAKWGARNDPLLLESDIILKTPTDILDYLEQELNSLKYP